MAVLELRYDPDPILTKASEPVLAVDEDLREFVRGMVETMWAEGGAGLAAPQVGRSIRVFVMRDNSGNVVVFINPEYTSKSTEVGLLPEGCLSFPGRPVERSRHFAVSVRATDLQGESFVYPARGFLAQCIQHEIDHLDGVTIHPIPVSEG